MKVLTPTARPATRRLGARFVAQLLLAVPLVLAAFAHPSAAAPRIGAPAPPDASAAFDIRPAADHPATFLGFNHPQGFRARFDGSSLHVQSLRAERWSFAVALRGIGAPDAVQPVGPAHIRVAANRLEYVRPGLTEWYVNDPRGIEQGFTIERAPGPEVQTLVLRMAVRTEDLALPDGRGERLHFAARSGAGALALTHLVAWDANGRSLDTTFESRGGEIDILVGVGDAVFPITVDPLLTRTSDFNLTGDLPTAGAGYGFSAVGDVNGDGFGDFAVGAPGRDADATGAVTESTRDTGAVYLYFGSPNGLVNAPTLLVGTEPFSDFGIAVSGGDINGDGFSDVVVAAGRQRFDLDGNGFKETWLGAVYVFSGSAGGVGAPQVVRGLQHAARLGGKSGFSSALDASGDFNGDGFDDVLVGALDFDVDSNGDGTNDLQSAGAAFLFTGGATGLSETPLQLTGNAQDGQQFGVAVAFVGDLDGNGMDEFVIGADRTDVDVEGDAALESRVGTAYLYFGALGGVTGAPTVLQGDKSNANFGASVAAAVDVNGDGHRDVAIGARARHSDAGATDNAGAVFVYLGNGATLDPSPVILEGIQPSAAFGESVAAAGDLNGDGRTDLLVGQPQRREDLDGDGIAEADVGGAFVYLSSDSGLVRSEPLLGTQTNSSFGYLVGSAGDVNGDGLIDIAVAAPIHDVDTNGDGFPEFDVGVVQVYLGPGGGLASQVDTFPGPAQLSALGASLTPAGDTNGDGFGDVIAGANEAAFVYYGSAGGLNEPAQALGIAQSDADFGHSVAGAGDVNGDGFADVLVGAPRLDVELDGAAPMEADVGAAYLYMGTSGGLSALPTTILGPRQGAGFGTAVASAGDLNGDGYGDIVIGAPSLAVDLDSNGTLETDVGAAYIYLGSATGIDPSAPSATLVGDKIFAEFGAPAAAAGDVNGDGLGDLIVGIPTALFDLDGDGQTEGGVGKARIYLSPLLTPSPQFVEFFGREAGGRFASAVAAAGDINGDGFDDVLVNAPSHKSQALRISVGAVYAYFGSPTGPSPTPTVLEGFGTAAQFGEHHGGVGDVNGDGLEDVVVTARGTASDLNGDGTVETSVGAAYLYTGTRTLTALGVGALQLTGDAAGFQLGTSVAGTDVDADGFADLIVAAAVFPNQTGAIRVFRNGATRPVQLRQLAASGQPLQPFAAVLDRFTVQRDGTHPQRQGRIRIEVELCPAGVAFDAPACTVLPGDWVVVDAAGEALVARSIAVTELARLEPFAANAARDGLFRWRARVQFTAVAGPIPDVVPAGPWGYLHAAPHRSAVQVVIDTDGDGQRDAVDLDDDQDGVDDGEDAFPLDAAAATDTDLDGEPDSYNAPVSQVIVDAIAATALVEDLDDDGDGRPDLEEAASGTDPRNRPPTIAGTANMSVTPGTAYVFTPTGTDGGDGAALSYSIHDSAVVDPTTCLDGPQRSDLPSWLAFETSTGRLASSRDVANDDFASLPDGILQGVVIAVSDQRERACLSAFDLAVVDTRPPTVELFTRPAPGPGGAYPGPVDVDVRCNADAGSACQSVRVSTDGADPSGAVPVPGDLSTIRLETTAIVRALGTDQSGNTSVERSAVMLIDEAAPDIVVVAPVDADLSDGVLIDTVLVIEGTAADVDTTVVAVDLQIFDIATPSNAVVRNGTVAEIATGVSVDDPRRNLPAAPVGTGDFSSWSLSTSTVVWDPDSVYQVTARATDAAGNIRQTTRELRVFNGSQAATSLSLDLSKSSLPFGGALDATLTLSKVNFLQENLAGLPLELRLFAPGAPVDAPPDAVIQAVTTANGSVTIPAIGAASRHGGFVFDLTDAWTVEARFAGNLLLQAASARRTLLVGISAGYAVIIQGRLPTETDLDGLLSHNRTADQVYQTLRARGFEDRNIFYFNFDTAQDANRNGVADNVFPDSEGNGVDGVPTRADIRAAIEGIAVLANDNPAPISIFGVDHGGDGTFYLNDEQISPVDLDQWITALEANMTAVALKQPRVIIMGACYSGSFIPALSQAFTREADDRLVRAGRIIATSAASNEESYKGSVDPDTGIRSGEYFLEELLLALAAGKSFLSGFQEATAKTEDYTRRGDGVPRDRIFGDRAAQHPLLDDNGDDVGSNDFTAGSGGDGREASRFYLGIDTAGVTNSALLPADIRSVTPTLFVDPQAADANPAELYLISTDDTQVQTAFIEVRAPQTALRAAHGTEQLTIGFLLRRNMLAPGQAEIPAGFEPAGAYYVALDIGTELVAPGKYEIYYYVKDVETQRNSASQRSVVYKGKGLRSDGQPANAAPSDFALLTPGNDTTQRTVLAFRWAPSIDADYLQGDPPLTYTLRVAQAPGSRQTPGACDAAILDDPLHLQEELPQPSTFIPFGVLNDATTYCWTVEAIDAFGDRTPSSDVFRFTTNNQNNIPGIITGLVKSDQAAAGIATTTATVQAQRAGQRVDIDQNTASLTVEINGEQRYLMFVLPDDAQPVQIVAAAQGFNQARPVDVLVRTVDALSLTGVVSAIPASDVLLVADATEVDLAVAMTAAVPPPGASEGVQFDYALTVSNASSTAADGVAIAVALSGNLTYLEGLGTGWSCPAAVDVESEVICALDTALAAAATSSELRLSVTPIVGGTLSSTASVQATQPDPVSGNDRTTVTVLVTEKDSDNDGLSDNAELSIYGTDPNLADTDGDGLSDGQELGLRDDADPSATTDPTRADSDDDGLLDGNNGVDPCEDCNNNGRVDAQETDPQRQTQVLGPTCAPIELMPGLNVIAHPTPPQTLTCQGLLEELKAHGAISLQQFDRSISRFRTCTVDRDTPGMPITGQDFGIVAGEGYMLAMARADSVLITLPGCAL